MLKTRAPQGNCSWLCEVLLAWEFTAVNSRRSCLARLSLPRKKGEVWPVWCCLERVLLVVVEESFAVFYGVVVVDRVSYCYEMF